MPGGLPGGGMGGFGIDRYIITRQRSIAIRAGFPRVRDCRPRLVAPETSNPQSFVTPCQICRAFPLKAT